MTPTTGHEVHFQSSSVNTLGPVNSEIGVQLSQLPVGSPVSGYLFTAGVGQSVEYFGPVMLDTAQTIGHRKIFLGFTYQFFNFDNMDGVNLKNFGAVFSHEPEPAVCGTQPSVPCINGEPIYTNDIVATANRIDLKVNQFVIVGTYGLTDRLDVTLFLPILNVRTDMYSNATLYQFEPPPVNHSFQAPLAPYSNTFFNNNSATGIGDLTLRGKFQVWRGQGERGAVAVGLDLRLPTGDAYNFLGSGTWGVRPWVTYSYTGRVSPHASVGLQTNGSSVLAGNVTTQPVTKGQLPSAFNYTAGVDAQVTKWLSASGAFIGASLLNAARIRSVVFTDYAGTTHPDITSYTGTVNLESLSVGAKVEPAKKVLLSFNVLFQVSHQGLHTKPVPLAGISYVF